MTTATPSVIQGEGWHCQDLGRDTWLFCWDRGYRSLFVTGSDGVIAIDPAGPMAPHFAAGIAAVTSAPVTTIMYSHQHRDHAAGAAALAPDAEVLAHQRAAAWLATHPLEDVTPPHRTLQDGDVLRTGSAEIAMVDLGPSHADGNLAMVVATDAGPLVLLADIAEPNWRGLPDTDIDGFRRTLSAALALDVAWNVSGHTKPNPPEWLRFRAEYLEALLAALDREWRAASGLRPEPGEGMVAFSERQRETASRRALDAIRPEFGSLPAFDAYGLVTADRLISYLVIGA